MSISPKKPGRKKTSGRSLLKRAERIFDIIDTEESPFPKSRLKKAGISIDAVDNWLDLIVFIQSQPRIRLTKISRNTVIEKLEKKFSQMSLKFFLDDTQPLEKRLQSLGAYADSVIVSQRLDQSD